MKFYCSKIKEDKQLVDIWDAFVDHVDSIYFPGASEVLDKQALAFEYESFRNCCLL